MALAIEMNRDIREFAPKIIGPFTARQIVCLGISLAYALPFAMAASFIPLYPRIVIAVLLATPTAACGWVQLYGVPLERFIIHAIRCMFIIPRKRIVCDDNELHMADEGQAKASVRKVKVTYPKGMKIYP